MCIVRPCDSSLCTVIVELTWISFIAEGRWIHARTIWRTLNGLRITSTNLLRLYCLIIPVCWKGLVIVVRIITIWQQSPCSRGFAIRIDPCRCRQTLEMIDETPNFINSNSKSNVSRWNPLWPSSINIKYKVFCSRVIHSNDPSQMIENGAAARSTWKIKIVLYVTSLDSSKKRGFITFSREVFTGVRPFFSIY